MRAASARRAGTGAGATAGAGETAGARAAGTDATVNRPGGGPGGVAPAKRLSKVNEGCNDRVRGAGDPDANRRSNAEGADAVVAGMSAECSVAQRESKVVRGLAIRVGGVVATSGVRVAG